MERACHCPGTGDTLRRIHAQSPCDTAGGYPGVGSPLRSEAVGKGKALSHSGWILLLCSFWSNFPTAVGLPLRWPPATRGRRFPHPPQAGRLLSCYGDQSASLLPSPPASVEAERRLPLGLWRFDGTRVTAAEERGPRRAPAGRGGGRSPTRAEQRRPLLAAARRREPEARAGRSSPAAAALLPFCGRSWRRPVYLTFLSSVAKN